MTEPGHVPQPIGDSSLMRQSCNVRLLPRHFCHRSYLDPTALPVKGTEVISINAYGCSMWSRPARIVARLPDRPTATSFLKVTTGENDRVMSEGQYEADKALYDCLPRGIRHLQILFTFKQLKLHGHRHVQVMGGLSC